MIRILSISLFFLITLPAIAQLVPKDSKAESLKTYYLVILTKGPDRSQDQETVNKIQAAHLANIDRLYKEGKIDLAGPFAEDGDWRGLFVFNAKDEDEVKDLLKTDPAISSGRLSYIIKPWLSAPGSSLR